MAKQVKPGRYTPPSSRRYTAEFKRDAVALLRSSDKSIAQVARELGVSDMSLGTWAKEEGVRIDAVGAAETEADRAEALQLRKRIKELEQEIEILKRFTAYWVKEGGR